MFHLHQLFASLQNLFQSILGHFTIDSLFIDIHDSDLYGYQYLHLFSDIRLLGPISRRI